MGARRACTTNLLLVRSPFPAATAERPAAYKCPNRTVRRPRLLERTRGERWALTPPAARPNSNLESRDPASIPQSRDATASGSVTVSSA